MSATPHFEHPPVSEVALAVYFSPPLALQTVHFGHLYSRWHNDYPVTADQPLLPPVPIESFDTPSLGVTFRFGPTAGTRVWFQTVTGDRVVQVQPDRLVLNWRRTSPEQPYPRYEVLRPDFFKVLDDLMVVSDDLGLPRPQVSQAEVSYTNPIDRSAWPSATVADVIAPWSGEHADSFLPPEEDVRFDLRYRIPDPETGTPVGRLYAGLQPARVQFPGGGEQRDTFLLQLFARGVPPADRVDGLGVFLDLAHHWVVNGFVSLTSSEMRKVWGQMTEETP